MEWYWWIILILIVYGVFIHYQSKLRRERLMEKYGDTEIVSKSMKKMIWQGKTQGQLIDSKGKPADVDQKVLKTKIKETWKYNKTGKNRYALRVMLEHGQVVGWDKK